MELGRNPEFERFQPPSGLPVELPTSDAILPFGPDDDLPSPGLFTPEVPPIQPGASDDLGSMVVSYSVERPAGYGDESEDVPPIIPGEDGEFEHVSQPATSLPDDTPDPETPDIPKVDKPATQSSEADAQLDDWLGQLSGKLSELKNKSDSRSDQREDVSGQSDFYHTERDRGTELVVMNDKGSVVAEADEEKRIATHDLSGCTAVAVTIEQSDGVRSGYIQHYSPEPEDMQASVAALKDAVVDVPEDARLRAVVLTPGIWAKDPNSDTTALRPADPPLVDQLTTAVTSRYERDVDVQIQPYVAKLGSTDYGAGTLMIEFAPGEEAKIFAEAQLVPPFVPKTPRELIEVLGIDAARTGDLVNTHLSRTLASLDALVGQPDTIGFLDAQKDRHAIADVLAVLPPEEIYRNYGKEALIWTSVHTWSGEAKEALRIAIHARGGCEPGLQRKLEVGAHRLYGSTGGTRDLISQYDLGAKLFEKDILEGIDLSALVRASALPDVVVSDKRASDYSITPVTTHYDREPAGLMGTIKINETIYFQWLDAPLGYLLSYKGRPNAVLCLERQEDSLKVVQLQRIKGTVVSIKEANRRMPPRGLMPLDWRYLMLSVANQIAVDMGVSDLVIQSAENNTWTYNDDGSRNPQFPKVAGEAAYDTPAKRLGFTIGKDKNWHMPVGDFPSSPPSKTAESPQGLKNWLATRLGMRREDTD